MRVALARQTAPGCHQFALGGARPRSAASGRYHATRVVILNGMGEKEGPITLLFPGTLLTFRLGLAIVFGPE
jgi:hypothetical protein